MGEVDIGFFMFERLKIMALLLGMVSGLDGKLERVR